MTIEMNPERATVAEGTLRVRGRRSRQVMVGDAKGCS